MTATTAKTLEPGNWAYDTEQDSDDDAVVVVVHTTSTPSDEYVVQEMPEEDPDWTVHTHNPGYDPDDPVVLAVYRDSLETMFDTIDRHTVVERFNAGDLPDRIVYAFPESRLDKVTLHDLN